MVTVDRRVVNSHKASFVVGVSTSVTVDPLSHWCTVETNTQIDTQSDHAAPSAATARIYATHVMPPKRPALSTLTGGDNFNVKNQRSRTHGTHTLSLRNAITNVY